MTTLLKTAIAELQKLPAEEQDAIAARWLAELEDEQQWTKRFTSTTDEQWDKLAAQVRAEIEAGRTQPLDDLLRPDESAR